ncbi:MAG: xanthine dehydrogenase family protein molybdopterin-binding subunit [Anaerolineaceae bacterium]
MNNAKFTVIGKSVPRVDAQSKVTGKALYPGDLSVPGMLHMKILFAERPHARITRLNTSKAEVYPGVVAVFTAKDVPVNEYGLQKNDQPVLCGPGSNKPGADVVRFVGDQIALIVAETEDAAAEARYLIEIEFEDLPLVTDPIAAMRSDSPLIHPELGDSNICVNNKICKGDITAGFAKAEVVVESEYHLPFQEHAYLQPEAGLAYIDEEGRVTVQCSGQWPHADRAQIAHSLGLPEEQVRVIYPAIGGAFGGREDMSVQIGLALASWKLHQPVKIIWSRRESIIGHCKRHPVTVKARWGATKAGKLVAAEMEIIADAGAYMYTSNKVLGNTTIVCTGPYSIPHVKVDTYGVYTNNIPTGAFRGFGAPQGNFIAEAQMNKLADALGMDPVEFRLRNVLQEGDTLGVGTPPPGPISIRQVIETAALKGGWEYYDRGWHIPQDLQKKDRSIIKRGIGFAAGFKNIGFSFGYQENSWARIDIFGDKEIEKVVAYHSGADVGQGSHTIMTQMVAEAVGVPLEKVNMVTSDTATMGNSGSASASRMTFMAGNSIRGAAQIALEKWQAEERPAVGEFKYLAPQTTPFAEDTGYSMPNFAYAYVAQSVEVEVDTETGLVSVRHVVSCDDVGQAINPQLIEGQIEGAIVQAQGYALMENFQMKDGRVLTDQLSTYLIPTVMDVPKKIESIIVEVPDPRGPWGARGLGELPFLPFAPAVLAAIHNAVGVWIDEIPATPEKVLFALRAA